MFYLAVVCVFDKQLDFPLVCPVFALCASFASFTSRVSGSALPCDQTRVPLSVTEGPLSLSGLSNLIHRAAPHSEGPVYSRVRTKLPRAFFFFSKCTNVSAPYTNARECRLEMHVPIRWALMNSEPHRNPSAPIRPVHVLGKPEISRVHAPYLAVGQQILTRSFPG